MCRRQLLLPSSVAGLYMIGCLGWEDHTEEEAVMLQHFLAMPEEYHGKPR
jgi:hypothetical protein